MKIASNLPTAAREHSRATEKTSAETPFSLPAATAETAAAAANTAGNSGMKTVPPGLEKVQARLMAIADEQRTHGQSQALSVISRNIARYGEQQAAATQTTEEASSEATAAAAETAADTETTAAADSAADALADAAAAAATSAAVDTTPADLAASDETGTTEPA